MTVKPIEIPLTTRAPRPGPERDEERPRRRRAGVHRGRAGGHLPDAGDAGRRHGRQGSGATTCLIFCLTQLV